MQFSGILSQKYPDRDLCIGTKTSEAKELVQWKEIPRAHLGSSHVIKLEAVTVAQEAVQREVPLHQLTSAHIRQLGMTSCCLQC